MPVFDQQQEMKYMRPHEANVNRMLRYFLVINKAEECELSYNMEMLRNAVVNNKDAFTLYSVHEMAQQILYRYKFMHFAANVGCRSWQQT